MPVGLLSRKVKSLNEIKSGDSVAIPTRRKGRVTSTHGGMLGAVTHACEIHEQSGNARAVASRLRRKAALSNLRNRVNVVGGNPEEICSV